MNALACCLVSSLHVICLLAPRVIPCRWTHPEAYRLFLELVSRYALDFERDASESVRDKIVKSVCIYVRVMGSRTRAFDDRPSSMFGSTEPEKMDMDKKWSNLDDRGSHQGLMRKANSFVAVELLEELTKSRKALILRRLIHLNILSVNIQIVLVPGCEINRKSFFGRLNSGRSMVALPFSNSGSVISSCWAPFDIYMENIMDGRQLPTTSTIDKLSEIEQPLCGTSVESSSHLDCNTNNISYCKADSDDHWTEGCAGSIKISNILIGKCLAKINEANSGSQVDECSSSSRKSKKQKNSQTTRSTVGEALEDITALFYNEEWNEIYTGNRHGLAHVWSN